MKYDEKEALAWILYELKLNELAKGSNVITDNMYIYAKENFAKRNRQSQKHML